MSTQHHQRETKPLGREFTRRAVNRTGLGAGAITALLASGAPRLARAEATPVPANLSTELHPIRYTLTGDHTEIVFTPATSADPLHLEYRDETGSLRFTGDEIDLIEHAAFGPVVSVLLRAAPDAYVDYLALLLPGVNPVAGTTDVSIEAVAVLIRHLTSIGGPRLVSGPLQTYDVRLLSGIAVFEAA